MLLLSATVFLLLVTGVTLQRTSTVDAVSGATERNKLRDSALTNENLEPTVSELQGEELILADSSFPSDLDPANGNGQYTIAYGIGETLFLLDDNASIELWLAQSWNCIDALTWEITIEPGIKFQNGKELTALGVKESLERAVLLSEDAAELLPVSSLLAQDLTLTIHTSVPCPNLIRNLSDPVFVIVDAASDQQENFSYFPVCTGPFIPTTFAQQTEIILRRFDDYHGGIPQLGGATIKLADDEARIQSLQNHTVDAAVDISQATVGELSDLNLQVADTNTVSASFLLFNLQNSLLSDRVVRQAIALAIDNQAAGGAFPLAMPFADYTDPYSYDPDVAAKLLEQNGYSNGMLSFRLALPAGDEELLQLAQTIKEDLEQIGISVTVKTYNDVFFSSRARYGKFDLLLFSAQTTENGDPQTFFENYFASGGDLNYGNYRDDQIDADIAQLTQEFDWNQRVLLADRIQLQAMKDAAYIFLGYPQTNLVYGNGISGLLLGSDGYRLTADTDKQ